MHFKLISSHLISAAVLAGGLSASTHLSVSTNTVFVVTQANITNFMDRCESLRTEMNLEDVITLLGKPVSMVPRSNGEFLEYDFGVYKPTQGPPTLTPCSIATVQFGERTMKFASVTVHLEFLKADRAVFLLNIHSEIRDKLTEFTKWACKSALHAEGLLMEKHYIRGWLLDPGNVEFEAVPLDLSSKDRVRLTVRTGEGTFEQLAEQLKVNVYDVKQFRALAKDYRVTVNIKKYKLEAEKGYRLLDIAVRDNE